MTDITDEMRDRIYKLVAPYNKVGARLSLETDFMTDLEWDSLTAMDFIAAVEDEFDIIITMQMQAEIATIGALVEAVIELSQE